MERKNRLPTYLQIPDIKIQAFERASYTCEYCGSTDDLCIDHIDNNSKNNTLNNFAVACRSCNLRKRDKTLTYLNWQNPRKISVFGLLDSVKLACQQVKVSEYMCKTEFHPQVQTMKQKFFHRLSLFKARLGDKTLGDFNIYTQYHATDAFDFEWHDKLNYQAIEHRLFQELNCHERHHEVNVEWYHRASAIPQDVHALETSYELIDKIGEINGNKKQRWQNNIKDGGNINQRGNNPNSQ